MGAGWLVGRSFVQIRSCLPCSSGTLYADGCPCFLAIGLAAGSSSSCPSAGAVPAITENRREGIATASAGDPETDEGANGTACPAAAYNHPGACFLSVRLERHARQRARLVSDNCHTVHPSGTFGHGGILHRVPANE